MESIAFCDKSVIGASDHEMIQLSEINQSSHWTGVDKISYQRIVLIFCSGSLNSSFFPCN